MNHNTFFLYVTKYAITITNVAISLSGMASHIPLMPNAPGRSVKQGSMKITPRRRAKIIAGRGRSMLWK